MKLPILKIADLEINIPIVQGAMGVRVSKAGLASAVTNEGGLGTISSVGIGPFEGKAKAEYAYHNSRALFEEIKKAKKLSNNGIIAVNILVAQTDYEYLAKACVEAGADIIVSGAGLPFMLPEYTKGSNVKLIPIVSSARAAKIIAIKWLQRYSILPDGFIVEGLLAGGHLGFSFDQVKNKTGDPLDKIVKEVIDVLKDIEEENNKKVPVIAAGGIFDGKDIAKMLELGAAGVQMGTRFVVTEECDVSPVFKQAYLDAKEEDIVIINSPVRLPGRVIRNDFVKNVIEANKKVKFSCPYHCLITCKPNEVPYCIARLLVDSAEGNFKEGFAFAGHNVYRVNEMTTVNKLMNELVTDAEKYYNE